MPTLACRRLHATLQAILPVSCYAAERIEHNLVQPYGHSMVIHNMRFQQLYAVWGGHTVHKQACYHNAEFILTVVMWWPGKHILQQEP